MTELEQQLAELLEASKALVASWETPLRKDAPPTAEAIYMLRDVINKIEGETKTKSCCNK